MDPMHRRRSQKRIPIGLETLLENRLLQHVAQPAVDLEAVGVRKIIDPVERYASRQRRIHALEAGLVRGIIGGQRQE